MQKVEKQDYYLAQIATVVAAVNAKDPKSIKISDFILKMDKKEAQKKLTREERAAKAKAFWMRIPKVKGKLPSHIQKEAKGK